jgi:hypothetical protein
MKARRAVFIISWPFLNRSSTLVRARFRSPWPPRAARLLRRRAGQRRLPWLPLSLAWRRARRPQVPELPTTAFSKDRLAQFAISIAYRWNFALTASAGAAPATPRTQASLDRTAAPQIFRSRTPPCQIRPFSPVLASPGTVGQAVIGVRSSLPMPLDAAAPRVTRHRWAAAPQQPILHRSAVPLRRSVQHQRASVAGRVFAPGRHASPAPTPFRIPMQRHLVTHHGCTVAPPHEPRTTRTPLALVHRLAASPQRDNRDSIVATSRRPVVLAWRDVQSGLPARAAPANVPAAHHSASAPAVAHVVKPVPAANMQRASFQTLEPAIAERLVEDVIRRVDRRTRIARERQGL